MSDLDIVIKALRDTAGDLYRYNDSLKDAGADALEALARNLEEAARQRAEQALEHAPVILGFDIPDVTEDAEDHCRLHCGCNGLNWGH